MARSSQNASEKYMKCFMEYVHEEFTHGAYYEERSNQSVTRHASRL
jgi:hypothetical protein